MTFKVWIQSLIKDETILIISSQSKYYMIIFLINVKLFNLTDLRLIYLIIVYTHVQWMGWYNDEAREGFSLSKLSQSSYHIRFALWDLNLLYDFQITHKQVYWVHAQNILTVIILGGPKKIILDWILLEFKLMSINEMIEVPKRNYLKYTYILHSVPKRTDFSFGVLSLHWIPD